MERILKVIISVVLASFCLIGKGQEMAFDHLDLKDGLSQISVTSLQQDGLGRVWIGTRDGLNCYDGVQIQTFRPIRGDTTSLLGHVIRELYLQDGYLWILTHAGVSRYDLRTMVFKRYPLSGILTIYPDGQDLLLGTTRGLFKLDQEKKIAVPTNNLFTLNHPITKIFRDAEGLLWIGTQQQGLYRYNHKKDVRVKILDEGITSLFQDPDNNIWIGTATNGVFLLEHGNGKIKHLSHQEDKNSLCNNIIRDIDQDNQGRLWIGTFYGLSIYDPETDHFQNFHQSDSNPYGLTHNSIYSIIKDSQGTMWVGTYFGGVNFFNPDYSIYNFYLSNQDDKEGLSYRVIGKMAEDHKGNLWIATEGGGLNYYDRKRGTFQHYTHDDQTNSLSHNNVKALLLDGKKKLYIGTHFGGLNCLDLQTGTFKVFKHNPENPKSIPSNIVSCIIAYQNHYLLGTKQGIILFNPKDETFKPFFEDKEMQAMAGENILSLFEDSRGILWIGSEKQGLSAYNTQTRELKNYRYSEKDPRSIGGNTIYQVFEDHQFRLWIATFGGGLNRYHRETDDFSSYTHAQNSIPSDFINGIQESRFGNLWMATSKGLCRFDVENNRVYNYDGNNGFPLSELNEGSILLTSQGEIFVGGMKGMISFQEQDLLKKPQPFNIVFSSLMVNNKPISPHDDTHLLQADLPFTPKITLGPDHTVFSIQYAACNYVKTNKNKYLYKLEDFNDEWVDAGYQTAVTYTNLDPGTYTLKVRGISSQQNQLLAEKTLIIEVMPPIYKTWYAYLFYLFILAGLIWFLNQAYLSKARLMDRLKVEQREKEQIRELNQSKLRFFTNISHEFRTPLTLIMGTLETVLEDQRIPSRLYRKLVIAHTNASRLKYLISELLDFRKLEQGHMKIKIREGDFGTFMEEIFQSFSEFAQHHEITYALSKPEHPLMLWYDPRQMEKVFYNLLSNAFKFVNDNEGIITVKIIVDPDSVAIEVGDNGPGMPPDQVDKVFDRFYQIDNLTGKSMGQGSGIGLALSKGIIEAHGGKISVRSQEGDGATFTVRLKRGKRHLNEDIIITQKQEAGKELAPIFTDHPEDLTLVETSLGKEGEKLDENAPRILIVEDNAEVRDMLKGIFQNIYHISEAQDGEEGLKIALENQPDLIISDVMMPKVSGTEMCAKLKRNIQTSHIPIILLTARTAMEYKIEGLETGADDYITKPFSLKLLQTRVRNLIHNRKNLQEKFSKKPEAQIKDVATNSIDQKLLEKAKDIILQHLDDTEFDVNAFAKEMGLGRTRLYSKIKGVTGQTPNEFIMNIRLKKAADMLLNDQDMNVSEIAYAVGFSTPRYFSRCFREHFGVSPSKYGHKPESEEPSDEEQPNNQ